MTTPITCRFVDVYDGDEHVRVETILVSEPPAVDHHADLAEWADSHVFAHTGDGNAAGKQAGYFAEILVCESHPELAGTEFEWGC